MASRLGTCCSLLVLLTACGGARRAQPAPLATTPDACSSPYFPADHPAQMFTDYAALRACGLLDYLDRMPMFEGWLAANSHPFGVAPDNLDRVRTAVVYRESSSKALGDMISVAEIAADVTPRQPQPDWVSWEIGSHRGFRAPGNQQMGASFWPRPGLAVCGDRKLLEATVTDDQANGNPHPELQPLLAGEGLLFQYAFGRFGKQLWQLTGTFGWYGPWDQDDPIDFVRLRLHAEPGGNLVASLRLRYAHGNQGLVVMQEWAREGIAGYLQQPKLHAVHPLLRTIVIEHQGRDLEFRLPLGQPREAIQKIERVVLSVMSNR